MLKGCVHDESTQRLARASRDVRVFLQTFFPVPFCRAYVAAIARSASVMVDNARHQGFGKFVFKGEARRQSLLRFEDDLKVGKGNNLSETSEDVVLHIPGCGTQKRQNHQEFFFRNSGEQQPFSRTFCQKIGEYICQ